MFRLTAVRVPDPQTEIRRIGIFEGQDAVASDALLAVTDPGDATGCQLESQVRRIQHDVFVVQSVTLEELVLHASSGSAFQRGSRSAVSATGAV